MAALTPFGEARDVRPDLALREDGLVVGMDELDRVLDRDDVVGQALVHPVEDRRERRGLAAAGRPRHQDEAAPHGVEGGDGGGQVQILDGRHLRRDQPQDGGRAALLAQEVDAEAGLLAHLVGEVHVARRVERLPEPGRRDRPEQIEEVALGQRAVAHALELAVDAHDRRTADREVEVRAAPLREDGEEPVDPVRVASGRTRRRRRRSRGASFLGREEGLEGLLALSAVVGRRAARSSHPGPAGAARRPSACMPAALPVCMADRHLEGLGVADQAGHVRRVAEDLEGRHAPVSVAPRQERLRDRPPSASRRPSCGSVPAGRAGRR